MSEIPTSWNERITSILSLFYDARRRLFLNWTLQPSIDYHKVMTKLETFDQLVAGNVVVTIDPDDNEKIFMKFGRIYMLNGVGVANRSMRVQLFEVQDSAVFSTNDYLTITASNSGELFLNEHDIIDYIAVDADTEFHWCPNEAIEGMQHRFTYVNGFAADSIRYQIKLEINPVPKEYIDQ
jgi:hypothetical protein